MVFPPKTFNGWATIVVGLALAILATYMGTLQEGQTVPLWAILLNAGVGYLALAMRGGGVELRKPGGGSAVGIILGLTVAAMALDSAGCKIPPLATAYRAHALIVTARDGVGETIANQQRAMAARCEAAHKGEVEPLRDCLHQVREPVRAWVRHIRPAITATASTYWLALESAYVLQNKSLDKMSKAARLACSALIALGVTLQQYSAHLGKLKAVLLGAVAGGKVLVCP